MTSLNVTDDIKKSFVISFGAHVLFILFALFATKVLLHPSRNNEIEIIRSSVRVDVVGMPKFTVQELKELQKNAAPAEPEAKPEEAPAPKVAETPKEEVKEDVIKEGDLVIEEQKKKSDFNNLLAGYSSKKVEKKKEVPGKKPTNTIISGNGSKVLDSLIMEGNKVSAGTALVGDVTGEASSEFSAYVQSMPEKVRVHWKLPSYLMNKNLKCRIKVYLNNKGQLVKSEVVESSGVAEFDDKAMRAVKDAAPFPAPSESVGVRLATYGIILGFPL